MPTTPPDPNGRPSPAQRAPDGTPPDTPAQQEAEPEPNSTASTNSHHPAATPSAVARDSDFFVTQQPAPQAPLGSDILRVLSDPTAHLNLEVHENTDDSPTVITRGIGDQPPPPMPLKVLASDPPQLAGRRLGNYELIEAVGTGGMATVLKARDLELARVVALKILPPTAARDSESVTRFKQEARAAALLDHENIARVYACGEDQGLHFIAFEFVEGINLRQLIERRGPLPAADAVRYMIQVAAGLAHAAGRGVVHRDIKPSNILITPDRRAKIVDMGLARQLEGPANGGLTQSGVTLGTFDYISPEQALDPRRTDVRSDIYSLGCTFYHALTGRPPVPEGTAAKKLHAHQHTDPLDPRQIRGDIPDELVVILARMMAKDPDRRYQTPEDLISHLKALAEQLKLSPDAVAQDSVVRAVRAASPVHPPQLRLGWVAAAAAVLVAVAAFALSSGDHGPVSTPPPWADDPKTAKGDPFRLNGSAGKANPGTPVDDDAVKTAKELAEKLAAAGEGVTRIRLAPGVYDLTQLSDPVVFRGEELELTGSVYPATVIRVHPAPTGATATLPAGAFAAIGSAEVTIAGVRFETATPFEDDAPEGPAATLLARDVGAVTLTDCVFPTPEVVGADGVGAVRVTRVGSRVRAERCVFAPAAFGLWVPDSCKAEVFDCGFGPHDAAIRVGESRALLPIEGAVQDVDVSLERSSFLLNPTSAVVANLTGGDGSGVKVTADYCVFAAGLRLDPLAALPGVANLLRQPRQPVILRAKSHPGEIQYAGGRKNAYYGVAALTVAAERGATYTFEQCKEKEFPVADASAVVLRQPPWAERDPLRTLADAAKPWRAFALKLSEPELYTPQDIQVKVIGAQFYNKPGLPDVPPWRAYPELVGSFPPPPKSLVTPPRTSANVLVWHPGAKDNPQPPNTYTDLEVLLKAARPGDEVLIRHNGVWPLDRTIDLEKLRGGVASEFRLTFKPDLGYTPILAPPGDARLDQTLFRLMNGKVVFQGVQFLLKPSKPRDGQTVTAVEVVGGESCVFEDCVFTLAEEDVSKAIGVLISDPKQVMAMPEAGISPTPQVKFERCVIRGKGRGVWVKASRAVQINASNSLAAIDGPLFVAEPGGRMMPGAQSQLQLTRVTAFAGGPLVELRGGRVGEMRASGLVPLDVHADACLFVAVPGATRPLVELDGIDADELMKSFPWQVQQANRYANFEESGVVMVARPATEATMTREWNWNQWVTFAKEPAAGAGKRLGKVVFENPPTGLASLAAFKPADAAVKSVDFPDLTGTKPIDVGAAVEKLPTPVTPEQFPANPDREGDGGEDN